MLKLERGNKHKSKEMKIKAGTEQQQQQQQQQRQLPPSPPFLLCERLVLMVPNSALPATTVDAEDREEEKMLL